MTVQHVRVAEGGQAIVGNVNATPEGVGALLWLLFDWIIRGFLQTNRKV